MVQHQAGHLVQLRLRRDRHNRRRHELRHRDLVQQIVDFPPDRLVAGEGAARIRSVSVTMPTSSPPGMTGSRLMSLPSISLRASGNVVFGVTEMTFRGVHVTNLQRHAQHPPEIGPARRCVATRIRMPEFLPIRSYGTEVRGNSDKHHYCRRERSRPTTDCPAPPRPLPTRPAGRDATVNTGPRTRPAWQPPSINTVRRRAFRRALAARNRRRKALGQLRLPVGDEYDVAPPRPSACSGVLQGCSRAASGSGCPRRVARRHGVAVSAPPASGGQLKRFQLVLAAKHRPMKGRPVPTGKIRSASPTALAHKNHSRPSATGVLMSGSVHATDDGARGPGLRLRSGFAAAACARTPRRTAAANPDRAGALILRE